MKDKKRERKHDEALSLLEEEIGMHEMFIEEEKSKLTEWGYEEKRKEREKIIEELKSAIRLIQPEEKAKEVGT